MNSITRYRWSVVASPANQPFRTVLGSRKKQGVLQCSDILIPVLLHRLLAPQPSCRVTIPTHAKYDRPRTHGAWARGVRCLHLETSLSSSLSALAKQRPLSSRLWPLPLPPVRAVKAIQLSSIPSMGQTVRSRGNASCQTCPALGWIVGVDSSAHTSRSTTRPRSSPSDYLF
ncbi:hypothetical protein BJX63DRAFT_362535 [Aspergillus granulosus]|uniref:Uncharacterized protein n=1 Tax=Aspergillus granulosus TaxID=176169 RepID=A0ABR4HWC4_9EURO